ncbi:DUF4870 domain-containing protein [Rothia sp. LK2588]|uniref:DUF4870 domain-containing protein n=1 Tax=Rothia sp. LK2588 TaxID=3114369 RepID=UPI0034CE790B
MTQHPNDNQFGSFQNQPGGQAPQGGYGAAQPGGSYASGSQPGDPQAGGSQPGGFHNQPGGQPFGGAQNGYAQNGYSQYGQNQYQNNQFGQNPHQPHQVRDAYGNLIPHDAKTISLMAHLSSLVAYLLSATVLSFIGPLIFWFIYKSKPGYAFVTANSARAFNFNVTMAIANIAAWLLTLVTFGLALPISALIWLATGVIMFVFHIIGAIKSNNGEVYNYPMQIRILKD